ncbi:Hypothetical protein NGAL_HAMBI2566_05910 [Neorhizobium galegae bv. orientalis]|nr:Hypothetical protein NGAL_HAMBI2566_05910 [Neorhizobium galegae bv. orientalis]
MTMEWGLVKELRDYTGRKVQGLDGIVAFLNIKIRDQQPPRIAVRDDGYLVRVLLGFDPAKNMRFQHHLVSGQKLLPIYEAAEGYAKEHGITDRSFVPGTNEYYRAEWEYRNGRDWSTHIQQ